MEAPEKAKQLFNKFKSIRIIFVETESGQTKEASSVVTDELAKQCALIAVDEILTLGTIISRDYEYKYWYEVRNEIEKI